MENPKVSIITITYNSESYLDKCIGSIIDQDYNEIEHIVIDGASTDNTLTILKKYEADIDVLISEKDSGIYNAMNKGLRNATGQIVGFLNSDDALADSNVISSIVELFETAGIQGVYGDLQFIDEDDKVVREWEFGRQRGFETGWHPAHPTFYVLKECYDQFGDYMETLSVSADFELMLRFLEKFKIKMEYLNRVMVKMRMGGTTTGSLGNMWKGAIQTRESFRINNIKYPVFYPIRRYLPKLRSYLFK